MDNRFDFESRKYVILLIIICSIFTIAIIKAFDFLPDEDTEQNKTETVQVVNPQEKTVKEESKEDSEVSKSETKDDVEHKSGVLYKSNDEEINSMFMEEIDIPQAQIDDIEPAETVNDTQKLSNAEIALKSIINARKYAGVEDYKNAMEEYQKAAKITSDKDLRAEIYDGITLLYLKNKNYKVALSFAEKANELSPSFTREFVIAKIFYESGKTGDAINRINKILKSK